MPIPSPGIPSATSAISSVELQTTQNNRAFYVYSGEVTVDTSETTMISVNDIGKRDILLCLEVGFDNQTTNNPTVRVKSNGQTIYHNEAGATGGQYMTGYNEIKLILPANTSLEVTLELSSGSQPATIAGYGYYLD